VRVCGHTPAADGRAAAAAAGVVRLSSFKGLTSVNDMNSIERKRTSTLAELNAYASRLRRDIAAMQLKIEFYASECSDGVEAYANEMRPHIGKAEASLHEVERLIAEIEATPVQLQLLAV